eukprot:6188450-Pleurochrysis_carterae.AAC.1
MSVCVCVRERGGGKSACARAPRASAAPAPRNAAATRTSCSWSFCKATYSSCEIDKTAAAFMTRSAETATNCQPTTRRQDDGTRALVETAVPCTTHPALQTLCRTNCHPGPIQWHGWCDAEHPDDRQTAK